MDKSREYEQMEEEKNDIIFLVDLLWIVASRLNEKKGEWQRDPEERYHCGIGD